MSVTSVVKSPAGAFENVKLTSPLLFVVPDGALNEALRRVIIEGGSALDIKALALKQSMVTLRRVGILNAIRGKTTVEEILQRTVGDG